VREEDCVKRFVAVLFAIAHAINIRVLNRKNEQKKRIDYNKSIPGRSEVTDKAGQPPCLSLRGGLDLHFALFRLLAAVGSALLGTAVLTA
jgi:hypothetical protein